MKLIFVSSLLSHEDGINYCDLKNLIALESLKEPTNKFNGIRKPHGVGMLFATVRLNHPKLQRNIFDFD
jgi:hypothetical protein